MPALFGTPSASRSLSVALSPLDRRGSHRPAAPPPLPASVSAVLADPHGPRPLRLSGSLTSDGQGAAPGTSVAALMLENARLEGAEQRARRQLAAVRAVAADITRTLDLRATLDLIAHHLGPLMGDGTGAVWLWDDDRQGLQPPDGADDRDGRHRIGRAVAEIVVKTRRGLIVNDCAEWLETRALAAFDAGAVIGEPLVYRGRLLGALVVTTDTSRRRFMPEDADLLQLFAAHASIAIVNATLFRQIRVDHEHLQTLSQQLVEIQEAERRLLARELHDEIGQSLTGLRLLLEASADAAPLASRRSLEEAQELVRGLLSRVRELSLDLRPGMLDDLGLLPALLWLVEHYQVRTRVRVDFRHAGLDGRRLPGDLETAAYRVVQEALTNVARHAAVGEATVRVCLAGDRLQVQVEDRGRGFDPAIATRGASTGLAGMRERTVLLGGEFTLDSAPARGTCVMADFPVTSGRPGAGADADRTTSPALHSLA